MTKLNIFIIILSFLSFIFSLFHIGESSFSYAYILPFLVFLLSLVFSNTYKRYQHSFIFKILVVQIIIRYCVLPALLSSGEYFRVGYDSYLLNTSVVIMIIELLSVFIILFLFQYKQEEFYKNRELNIKPLFNIPIIFIICSLMLAYIYSSGTFEIINPIWGLSNYVDKYITNNEELEVSSYGVIIFNILKALLALAFISLVINSRYIKENRKKWVYLTIILLTNLYIVGTSRFSIILFTLPLLILILGLIDKRDAKKVLTIATSSMLVVLAITSIAKFSRYGNEADLSSIISANSLNAYFSGPGLIAVGLEASYNVKPYETTLFFINDIFQNIPLLSNFTVNDYKTNIVFNESIYGHRIYADQIVPFSISGIFHFGILGLNIYSSLFLAISLWFERIYYKTAHIGFKYIYIYLAISLSLVFMVNLAGIYALLIRTFIFLYIPFFIITFIPKFKFR